MDRTHAIFGGSTLPIVPAKTTLVFQYIARTHFYRVFTGSLATLSLSLTSCSPLAATFCAPD